MIQICEKSEALRPILWAHDRNGGEGMQYTDRSGYTYRAAISGKNKIRRFDAL